jgi:hypothetical protein
MYAYNKFRRQVISMKKWKGSKLLWELESKEENNDEK